MTDAEALRHAQAFEAIRQVVIRIKSVRRLPEADLLLLAGLATAGSIIGRRLLEHVREKETAEAGTLRPSL